MPALPESAASFSAKHMNRPEIRDFGLYCAALLGRGTRPMAGMDIAGKLRSHGVTPTAQRVEIATVLLARPQHLSAEQIIDRLKANGSRVSKATVYNSLNLFSETGLVREINVDPARKYYDSTTHPHHHFYHVGTGELLDIDSDQLSIRDLPPLPRGTEKEGVEVLIRIRDREP
jgi:Fur family iron response transcriptional regulator